jgi:nucleoside-diphosphate-sugar epimerase
MPGNDLRPSLSMNPLATDLDHVLAHTEGLWEELRGQRIFVTGGTGFFGCWLLESFAWANDKLGLGARAVVLTRNAEAFKNKVPHLASHPAIQFHAGDVRNFAFPAGSFSHAIHAATEASAKLNNEKPLLMFDTIVEGTRRTLEFARQSGARKFLLTSSGAVYGRQPAQMTHLSEDYLGGPDTGEPSSAYGEGKRTAEMLCTLYGREFVLEPKIARCFAFVGPYLPLDVHFAIGNFIRDGLRGGLVHVSGDGTPFRSYLYAADLAIWLWTILFRGQSARAYNVGSEAALSIAEVAREVAKAFRPPVQVVVAREAEPGKPAERYVPATRRARVELGLAVRVPIDHAIRRTAEWARKSQDGITTGL